MIIFEKADKDLYLDFRQELEKMYIDTFTNGISAQYIPKEEAESYLKKSFKEGYAIFGFNHKKLISALIVTPLSFDKDIPIKLKKLYTDKDSLYITEVLVEKSHRGQGIGYKLMEVFEENLGKTIKHVLLRVWQENKPAVKLYEKSGFKTCDHIVQKKLKPDQKEIFRMHKNYMVKLY